MADTSSDQSISVISLSELRDEYDGQLLKYCQAEMADDVLIQFSAEIDVAGQGTNLFEVMVAVTWHYQMAEPVAALAEQLGNDKAVPLFAWVPAHLFGTDSFSVHISEHDLGENLAHGLIGEVIREAGIEDAVAKYKPKKS